MNNVYMFLREHRHRHYDACRTVYWFLKGGTNLSSMTGFYLWMHSEKVADNVIRNNALLRKLKKVS